MLPLLLIGGIGALLLLLANSASASNATDSHALIHQGDQPAKGPTKKPATHTTSTTADKERAAARALGAYLRSKGDFGTKAKPSAKVHDLQAQMGKITPDGVVGPKTEARALELGEKLPARQKTAKLIAVTTPPGGAAPLIPPDTTATTPEGLALERFLYKDAAPVLPPDTPPKSVIPARTSTSTPSGQDPKIGTPAQYAAARALNAYLRSPGADFGYKGRPSKRVHDLQAQMGRITADGIDGPETTARAKQLGQTLPARTLIVPMFATPAAKPAAAAARPAPAKAASQPPAAARPAAKPAAAATSTPSQSAARALDAYLQSGGRDRARIATLQWPLGLDADGIPGAQTRAAVQHELGSSYGKWPELTAAKLTGGVPGGATKREAAERLERYWNLPASSHNAQRIQAYQRVLGVPSTGTVGPQTRSAASAALGRTAKL